MSYVTMCRGPERPANLSHKRPRSPLRSWRTHQPSPDHGRATDVDHELQQCHDDRHRDGQCARDLPVQRLRVCSSRRNPIDPTRPPNRGATTGGPGTPRCGVRPQHNTYRLSNAAAASAASTLLARHHMGVGVEREADRRVTEPLAHDHRLLQSYVGRAALDQRTRRNVRGVPSR